MMKLKMEHGDEAIPISHKFVKEGGLFNSRLFAREVVELTAAVQERRFKSSLAGGKKKIDFTIGDSDKLRPDTPPGPAGTRTTNPGGRKAGIAPGRFEKELKESKRAVNKIGGSRTADAEPA